MDCDRFNIKGFVPSSLVDWPDRICSVIFLGGCSFRCPFCHNSRLVLQPDSLPAVPVADVIEYLSERRNWIDGVTVTGGEPTWTKTLPDLLGILNYHGIRVKLDTNGSNPLLLERITREKLVHAVYMDVKAPLQTDAYSRAAGVRINPVIIKKSIQLLRKAPLEVAFRTTVVPGFIAEPELEAIRRELGDAREFIVQRFRGSNTLEPSFSELPDYGEDRFQAMKASFEIRKPRKKMDGLFDRDAGPPSDTRRKAAS